MNTPHVTQLEGSFLCSQESPSTGLYPEANNSASVITPYFSTIYPLTFRSPTWSPLFGFLNSISYAFLIVHMCATCPDYIIPFLYGYTNNFSEEYNLRSFSGIYITYVTGLRAGQSRFDSDGATDFSLLYSAQTGSGPTRPPILFLSVAFPGGQTFGREADHSPPPSVKVLKAC